MNFKKEYWKGNSDVIPLLKIPWCKKNKKVICISDDVGPLMETSLLLTQPKLCKHKYIYFWTHRPDRHAEQQRFTVFMASKYFHAKNNKGLLVIMIENTRGSSG